MKTMMRGLFKRESKGLLKKAQAFLVCVFFIIGQLAMPGLSAAEDYPKTDGDQTSYGYYNSNEVPDYTDESDIPSNPNFPLDGDGYAPDISPTIPMVAIEKPETGTSYRRGDNGIVTIRGYATRGSYKLEWGEGTNPTSWILLGIGSELTQSAIFGHLGIAELSLGSNTIRLSIEEDGILYEDRVIVNVCERQANPNKSDEIDEDDDEGVLVNPGSFIYYGGHSVHSYSVDGSGKAIRLADTTPVYPVKTPLGQTFGSAAPQSIWGDNDFLYVGNAAGAVNVFEVDHMGRFKLASYAVIPSEDSNGNGKLDPGEDENGNGTLDDATWCPGVCGDGRFLYVAAWDRGLHVYEVAEDGELLWKDSHVYFPGEINFNGDAADVWCDNEYIYVANWNHGLDVFKADDSGQLTHLANYCREPEMLAKDVWSDGTFIYLAARCGGINVFSFDGSELTLLDYDVTFTEEGWMEDAQSVWGDDKYLYVGCRTFDVGNINVYEVNKDLGQLTWVKSTPSPWARGIDGRSGYVFTSDHDNGLSIFSADEFGALTQTDTSNPYNETGSCIWAGGDIPDHSDYRPQIVDQLVYYGGGTLNSYSVDRFGEATRLHEISPVYIYNHPQNGDSFGSAAPQSIWGDDNFLYVGNAAGAVNVFTVDEMGRFKLVSCENIPTEDLNGNRRLDPGEDLNDDGYFDEGADWCPGVCGDGRFIYVAAWNGGVHVYAVDELGNLTWKDSHRYFEDETLHVADAMDIWCDDKYIYVANWNRGLDIFSADDTGKLTPLANYNSGTAMLGCDVWADGKFIYLAARCAGINVFSFDGSELTLLDYDMTFNGDVLCNDAQSVWGDGKYLYVGCGKFVSWNVHGGVINIYEVNEDTGQLRWIDATSSPWARGIIGLEGRLFAADHDNGFEVFSVGKFGNLNQTDSDKSSGYTGWCVWVDQNPEKGGGSDNEPPPGDQSPPDDGLPGIELPPGDEEPLPGDEPPPGGGNPPDDNIPPEEFWEPLCPFCESHLELTSIFPRSDAYECTNCHIYLCWHCMGLIVPRAVGNKRQMVCADCGEVYDEKEIPKDYTPRSMGGGPDAVVSPPPTDDDGDNSSTPIIGGPAIITPPPSAEDDRDEEEGSTVPIVGGPAKITQSPSKENNESNLIDIIRALTFLNSRTAQSDVGTIPPSEQDPPENSISTESRSGEKDPANTSRLPQDRVIEVPTEGMGELNEVAEEGAKNSQMNSELTEDIYEDINLKFPINFVEKGDDNYITIYSYDDFYNIDQLTQVIYEEDEIVKIIITPLGEGGEEVVFKEGEEGFPDKVKEIDRIITEEAQRTANVS